MADTLLLSGDCLAANRLRALPDASVHACVTDPPYDLTDGESARGFMGKEWDGTGIAFDPALWREILRVLKPGGYVLAFGGTRTYHRMTAAIEAAGFAIRDCISWQYGSGFPKSLNLPGGWGTALKPAWEPIVVARAPFPGTVAGNVATHGTGAMNIDGCRVPGGEGYAEEVARNVAAFAKVQQNTPGWKNSSPYKPNVEGALQGRWPANLITSCDVNCDGDAHAPGCPVAALDAQHDGASRFFNRLPIEADDFVPFFYGAKASRAEREAGCGDLPARSGAEAVEREEGSAGTKSPRAGAGRTAASVRNHHPTVKPVSVMRWCVRLITPPGGIVLDPFMGSGTTGIAAVKEGVAFIGIEREAEYLAIAKARVANAKVPE